MKDKFIYVYNELARDKMLSAGFFLVKADDRNGTYVFEAVARPNREQMFALADVSYLTSNVLTF